MRYKTRNRSFIDNSVQGQLAFRVFAYWTLCMLGMFCLLSGTPIVLSWFIRALNAHSAIEILMQTWRMFWPALFAAGLLLPLLLLDVIRLSHRFAGPVYRLRQSLRDLSEGKPVAPVKFRDGDFWNGMAEEFNRVAARLRDLEPASNQEPLSAEKTSIHTENTN